jgi:SAM-dependent methyltransferase
MTEGVLSSSSLAATPLINRTACPVCLSSSFELFFELSAVPVHCNILWHTAESARSAPKGAVRLALCRDCGLVFNAAFDPSLVSYDETYENSLHHSPKFETYAEELARDLAQRLDLSGKLIVEVGCGKGEFLRRLCHVAGAFGVGVDASYDPALAPADPSVRFIREPFTELPTELTPSLVLCRHVIEHISQPEAFVTQIGAVASRTDRCTVFLEVPHVLFTLRDLGIWDIIYEHCSYFSISAISRLCELSGLRVERAYPAFGNQFLCIEAVPARSHNVLREDELQELSTLADRFSTEYVEKRAYWEARLRKMYASGKRVVLWGAGSKGITFVNTVAGGDRLAGLVDLNPRKRGRYVAGTGQRVVAPEELREVAPDVIIVMNPLYREEIQESAARLGLRASVEVA